MCVGNFSWWGDCLSPGVGGRRLWQHCFLGIDFWASIIAKLILTPKQFKLAERLWQDFDQNVYIFVFPKSYTSGIEEYYAECFRVNIALFHC